MDNKKETSPKENTSSVDKILLILNGMSYKDAKLSLELALTQIQQNAIITIEI